MTSVHWYERVWDRVGDTIDRVVLAALAPLKWGLVWWLGRRFTPGSVLHISDPVHTAQQTVELLRAAGCKAAYLAIGPQRAPRFGDYRFRRWRVPGLRVLHEAAWFWGVARRYHVIHSHFMLGVTRSGWEWFWWKRLGRKLVVHYRGCEVRDRARNMALHPQSNICQDCDYRGRVCSHPAVLRRRAATRRYGDVFLVTTPDLWDFAPRAEHVPFFAPNIAARPAARRAGWVTGGSLRIVHATNHPGIEGSRQIAAAVAQLQRAGYPIEYVSLTGVPHERVLAEVATADLTIGKLKMGYYANAQVESLALGVPAVTYVRPEYVTRELEQSGLILCRLDQLESTLRHYLDHPEALDEKRRQAAASAARLHDNRKLVERLLTIYQQLAEPDAGTAAGPRGVVKSGSLQGPHRSVRVAGERGGEVVTGVSATETDTH